MSTATVTSSLDTTSELSTLAQVAYETGKDEAGKAVIEYAQVSEDQGKEAEKNQTITLKVKGKEMSFPVHAVTYQTFKFAKANTLNGVQQLATDETGKINEEEICNMFNRGISVKQANKARQLLEATEEGNPTFQFQEGVFDLTPYIAVTTSTRKSVQEKTLDTLKGMPPEQQAQVLAALQQLLASQQG